MADFYKFITLVAVWLVLWVVAWRVFYGPLSSRHINYVDKFAVTAAYFLVLTALAVIVFRGTLLPLADTITKTSVVVLAVAIGAQFVVYILSRRFLQKPQAMIDRHPLEFFLTFDYRYLISKAFEVLFQQAMIAALILTIHRITGNLLETVFIYMAVFALAHIPMMKLFGTQTKSFAWFYIAAAIASGIIFPPLILNVDGGFLYAYAIHSFFYTVLGGTFWIISTLKHVD